MSNKRWSAGLHLAIYTLKCLVLQAKFNVVTLAYPAFIKKAVHVRGQHFVGIAESTRKRVLTVYVEMFEKLPNLLVVEDWTRIFWNLEHRTIFYEVYGACIDNSVTIWTQYFNLEVLLSFYQDRVSQLSLYLVLIKNLCN